MFPRSLEGMLVFTGVSQSFSIIFWANLNCQGSRAVAENHWHRAGLVRRPMCFGGKPGSLPNSGLKEVKERQHQG